MDKCPTCSAEIRPGDNFCLNCGNRLPPTASSPQLGLLNDATIPAQDWSVPNAPAPVPGGWYASGDQTLPNTSSASAPGAPAPAPAPAPVSGGWHAASDQTLPDTPSATELPTIRADLSDLTVPSAAAATKDENSAHLVIRGPNGNILQDYLLEKSKVVIGRVPESDINFPGDLLVSRTHATIIRYEDGHYVLRDEGSANGTLVNNEPLARMANRTLQDGDEIQVGDHTLTFKALASISPDIEKIVESETVIIPSGMTFENAAQVDDDATVVANDPLMTGTMDIADLPPLLEPEPSAQSNATPAPAPAPAAQSNATPAPAPAPVAKGAVEGSATPVVPAEEPPARAADVTVASFRSLSQPSLPNMDALATASATLNEQITSLQQQLRATQEGMHKHDAEVAQTADRLRVAMRRLAERMDNTIGSVARSRDEMDWNGMQQALQDVISSPRDIGYATEFARRAPAVDKAFKRYQDVFTTLSECNSLLRGLIGEEKP